MSLGHNVALDMTAATTTPKYVPVVNELIARSPRLAELHPDQPTSPCRASLRLLWELVQCLKALSGMDEFSLHGLGGAHGIFGGVLVMRAYHESRGDHGRDEVISTFASHPTNPSTAAALGYRVVEIAPGPRGSAELEAVKAAVSDRTAGLLLNNPEDTGVFNPDIDRLAGNRPRGGRPVRVRPGERERDTGSLARGIVGSTSPPPLMSLQSPA